MAVQIELSIGYPSLVTFYEGKVDVDITCTYTSQSLPALSPALKYGFYFTLLLLLLLFRTEFD